MKDRGEFNSPISKRKHKFNFEDNAQADEGTEGKPEPNS
jgi:hypothetical protein